jgi:hypothetical protein
MKNSIFDAMHDWIIETENKIILKSFFSKIENYMRLHLLKRDAKKKLLIISMKNTKIISKFYHRIFKLWKRIKISDEDRMNEFRIFIRSTFVMTLLDRKYQNMKAMFEIVKTVKNQKNDINNRYSRDDKSQKNWNKKSNRSIFDKPTTTKIEQSQNKSFDEVKLLTTDHFNSQFDAVNIKSIEWVNIWYDAKKNSKKLDNDTKNQLIKQKRCWNCRESEHRNSDIVCINYDRKKRLNLAKANTDFDSDSDKSEKK